MVTWAHNGEVLNYREVGGPGDVALFLHSLGASSAMWEPQLSVLAGRFRCIAPDCRGHGGSTCNGRIDRDALVADLAMLLDHLRVDAAHVIGISMGGCWALRLYELAPDRVRSLVLVDTFASFPDPDAAMETRRQQLGSISMQRFATTYVESTLRGDVPLPLRRRLEEDIAGCSPDAYLATAEACFRSNAEAVLKTIRVPTLVLVGELDDRAPPYLSQHLADAIPGARIALLPGAGHLSNLDQPGEFNELLGSFLNATMSPPDRPDDG